MTTQIALVDRNGGHKSSCCQLGSLQDATRGDGETSGGHCVVGKLTTSRLHGQGRGARYVLTPPPQPWCLLSCKQGWMRREHLTPCTSKQKQGMENKLRRAAGQRH